MTAVASEVSGDNTSLSRVYLLYPVWLQATSSELAQAGCERPRLESGLDTDSVESLVAGLARPLLEEVPDSGTTSGVSLN